MATPTNSYELQMAQMRISQLELENKMLKEQLRAYELQFSSAEGKGGNVSVAPTFLPKGVDSNLGELQATILAERDAACAKLDELLNNAQKLLQKEPDMDEEMATEEVFAMPSGLNSQESDVSLETPIDSPISTQ